MKTIIALCFLAAFYAIKCLIKNDKQDESKS